MKKEKLGYKKDLFKRKEIPEIIQKKFRNYLSYKENDYVIFFGPVKTYLDFKHSLSA